MELNEIEKAWKRGRSFAFRHNESILAEDFAQFYVAKIALGRKAKIWQIFSDFKELHQGNPETKNGSAKLLARKNFVYLDDEISHDNDQESLKHEIVGGEEFRSPIEDFYGLFHERDIEILKMIASRQYNQPELAETLGISEGEVDKIISWMGHKIRQSISAQMLLEKT